MKEFNVSDWFASRASLNIQSFSVDGIKFELMALTDEQKEEVETCATSSEMLKIAADFGLSYSRNRVIDDENLAKDIDKLWAKSELDIDVDPSVQTQVGEKVIEISGLVDAYHEQLKEESEAESVISGDDLDSDTLSTDLGQLTEDRTHSPV